MCFSCVKTYKHSLVPNLGVESLKLPNFSPRLQDKIWVWKAWVRGQAIQTYMLLLPPYIMRIYVCSACLIVPSKVTPLKSDIVSRSVNKHDVFVNKICHCPRKEGGREREFWPAASSNSTATLCL